MRSSISSKRTRPLSGALMAALAGALIALAATWILSPTWLPQSEVYADRAVPGLSAPVIWTAELALRSCQPDAC